MQLLMSAAAHARVAGRIDEAAAGLDIITMEPGGAMKRGDAPVGVADVDPEIFWVSQDAYRADLMGPMYRKLLEGQQGRWVQVFNAGLDNPTFKRVMAKGLRLTKNNAQAPAIAEYVLARALALLHPIEATATAQSARDWRRVEFREVGHTRWLIVGYGSIGREIARRVRPFGAHITVMRREAAHDPDVDAVVSRQHLTDVLGQSDVVVLACALNDSTRDIADEAFFQAIKPDAILINIGRGELVDEDALRRALDDGRLGAAVLDVFRTEPLPPDAWPWTHPKVRLTAHASNAGGGVIARGDALFLENLRRFCAGEALLNEAQPFEVGL